MDFISVGLPIALAIIMFTLGLGLTIDDFTRVFKNPRNFLVGFICQLVFLPLVAFVIAKFSLPPELAIGLMIIAISRYYQIIH